MSESITVSQHAYTVILTHAHTHAHTHTHTHTMYLKHARWPKEFGVVLASEQQQCRLSNGLLGDNLEAEAAPMTFSLKPCGEEIRAVPLVFVPRLQERVLSLLDQNLERLTRFL